MNVINTFESQYENVLIVTIVKVLNEDKENGEHGAST